MPVRDDDRGRRAYLDEAEAEALRNYVLKGGFLWADDFWGECAWQAWTEQFTKAFPSAQYPIRDLPKDHPLFRTIFDIGGGVPQMRRSDTGGGPAAARRSAARKARCRMRAASSIQPGA